MEIEKIEIVSSECGTTQEDATKEYGAINNKRYFFENCFGGHTCQGEECVYEYVMQHEQVEVE